jgi:hypothetical protein
MATDGELTPETVDDGQWVLFWTLAIVTLYVGCLVAVTAMGVFLL